MDYANGKKITHEDNFNIRIEEEHIFSPDDSKDDGHTKSSMNEKDVSEEQSVCDVSDS